MRRNAAQMADLVAQYRAGDRSLLSFCELHNINKHTFRYWLSRCRSEQESAFIPLGTFVEAADVQGKGFELRFPNGVILKTSAQNLSLIISLIRSV
jgi:transposase-like protein